MKDFDNSLVTWNNRSTLIVSPDSIPIRFDGGLFGDEIQENNDTRYVLKYILISVRLWNFKEGGS